MDDLPVELSVRIAGVAADRQSGASDLLDAAIQIFRDGRAAGVPTRLMARAICRAQPTMASLWNASLEALVSDQQPDRFERFAHRVWRSADAVGRFAVECLTVKSGSGPLRFVTISSSRSVSI